MLLHSADIVINPRAGQAAFALAIVGISPPPLPAETGQKREFGLERLEKDPVRRNCGGNYRIPMEGEGSRLNIALSLFFALSLLCGALLNRLFIVAVAGGGGGGDPQLLLTPVAGAGAGIHHFGRYFSIFYGTLQEYADKCIRPKTVRSIRRIPPEVHFLSTPSLFFFALSDLGRGDLF